MNKKRKGFTLIELVVVMAIIAILALIIVAAIQAARRQSINSQRTGNIQTVETALEARFARCGTYVGDGRCAEGTAPADSYDEETDLETLVEDLRDAGFLSQTLSGDLTRGYRYTVEISSLEMVACEFTGEEDNTCTAEEALYRAVR